VLRAGAQLPVTDALTIESAAYSMLLAGREFQSWLRERGAPRASDGDHRVTVTRDGDVLTVCLDRVARRNAVDAAMRDAISEALLIAESDPSIRVELIGNGPSFSAGGDLDEFGSATDVSVAHLVRVGASSGAAIARMPDRVTARLHGVCMGAGVELPAFAGRVVAAPGTELALPEVPMGLIPGAGGTVSISRRIGRWRTLWLGLTACRLPVTAALEWGLVDAVE
jgi:enoyl-CoA hydratase/carnithine racemase